MADQTFARKVSFVVRGFDLQQPLSDNPELEDKRQEVVSFLERIEEAKSKRPASLEMMDESLVSLPEHEELSRCSCCAYTRVVNYVVVDHWDNGEPDCGNCGTYVESETYVEDGEVYDVIRAWDYLM